MKVPNQFAEIHVKQPNCVFAVKPSSASDVVAYDETTGSIKIIYSHGLPYYFFVRKPTGSETWTLTEMSTGTRIGNYRQIKQAISDAQDKLDEGYLQTAFSTEHTKELKRKLRLYVTHLSNIPGTPIMSIYKEIFSRPKYGELDEIKEVE